MALLLDVADLDTRSVPSGNGLALGETDPFERGILHGVSTSFLMSRELDGHSTTLDFLNDSEPKLGFHAANPALPYYKIHDHY